MWVFGYGSLIWKVDFPYKASVVGHIKGYYRRFWQASEDHRGVPGKPGRVVTLVKTDNPEAQVWGVAYEIAKENEKTVSKYLDYREKGGYEKVTVTFYPEDKSGMDPFELLIYIGLEHNKNYAGDADMYSIAKQIAAAAGPSGPNSEYLFNLAAAMRTLAPNVKDEHLFTLEKLVKEIQIKNGLPHGNGS